MTPKPRSLFAAVALPNGANGMAYSQQLSALNGQPPYAWSIVSGLLPAGMGLATNALISAVPTASGTPRFAANVSDASRPLGAAAFALELTQRIEQIDSMY